MPFTHEFNTLLYDSNNNIINIDLNNGITINTFNSQLKLTGSRQIYKNDYSFVTCHFDIDENNMIYGLLNTDSNALQYVTILNKSVIKNTLIKYDPVINTIKFPYIKKTSDHINIFYYLINNTASHTCSLIHNYRINNKWISYIVDTIDFDVLTNFKIIESSSSVTAFYFKLYNEHEELFMRNFSLITHRWDDPVQLTCSNKSKMYLSIIKDKNNLYHICYSENNSNKYFCYYINGYICNNTFDIINNGVIDPSVACSFPTILYYNNLLYIQWIEYNVLNYSYSSDYGKSWCKKQNDNISLISDFSCYRFSSNITNKNIIYSFFNQNGLINMLGLR